MPVKLGMNGFGRIGRYLLRLLADDQDLQIAAINARADNAALAYLFKYDSTYGTFAGSVDHDENGIIVNGRHIAVTRCKPGEWEWKRLGVNIAVETTGTIKDAEGLAKHLACGAEKVVISAPAKDVDAMVVMGVNDHVYDCVKHKIISAASCTTNCLAPVAKVLHEKFGIRHGLMTTIHSYTMSQRILDGTHKDWRRGRAAAVSMVPSSTGAAKAVGIVMPELEGKLNGMSVRVPTFDCSLVDLTCEVERHCDAAAVNEALKAASEGSLGAHMGFTEEPLVSIDFRGSTHGGVVDALSTQVLDGTMVKVLIWYDNEAGFTNQLLRLLRMVGGTC
ncbi:MAG: type I glyceraldehyde-3-phosphate dehydrogenase [Desulfovibrio sp.]|uniref:type I glyceraldehyde-3-phosphate dehydrogenase n=1 Tax=Desulfovibrio sp. TaxID=885 RepID=UPI002A36B2CA|nr:type I glyceraldehyde-3-phosphate dehydrogenase [Desulfovibrio sp.]MDY0259160.1 type I glyceraldehyde-3-phosphate dehydrogenase [Desulfovibrio sp.]